MKQKNHFLTILLALVFAMLACNLGSTPALPTALPPLPSAIPQIPTFDPNIIETLENEWLKAIAEAVVTGNFSVTITEGQLTDFINRKNAENPNSTVSAIQVFLRDGQIQFLGNAESEAGSATLEVLITVSVTAEGKVQFDVTTAKIGPFPVPESMLDSISQSVNEALSSPDAQFADKIFVESVEIRDGFMTIMGTMK